MAEKPKLRPTPAGMTLVERTRQFIGPPRSTPPDSLTSALREAAEARPAIVGAWIFAVEPAVVAPEKQVPLHAAGLLFRPDTRPEEALKTTEELTAKLEPLWTAGGPFRCALVTIGEFLAAIEQRGTPVFERPAETTPAWATGSYATPEQLTGAFAAVQLALPKVEESAYQPSGKSPLVAKLAMLVAAPVAAALTFAIGFALVYGVGYLFADSKGTFGERRTMGKIGLLVDLALLFLVGWLPSRIVASAGRPFKNRSPRLAGWLAGLAAFAPGLLLFFPFFEGQSLAPTDLSFIFIPIKWLGVLLGVLGAPLAAAFHAAERVKRHKFSEEANVYLNPILRARLPLGAAAAAIRPLWRGDLKPLASAPRLGADQKKTKQFAEVVIWGHEQAPTAYLEMEAAFAGKVKGTDKSETWLCLSRALSREQAHELRSWLGGH